jgi:hypothetical protein
VIGFFRRVSDERYKRATKRRRTEEIMGWICVPLLIMLGWYVFQAYERLMADRSQPAREQVLPSGVGAPPLRQ